MFRLFAAAIAIVVAVPASTAWACGAPVIEAPGRAGTAFWEGPNQLSVFVATDDGYSWDRLKGPDWTRTHVLDVTGTLSGNVETNARVDRAIAGEDGKVVELSSAGTTTVFASSDQSTVFGAALGPDDFWRVLAYDPSAKSLTLMTESAPDTFSETATLSADCGQASMLDSQVEPDGTFIGLCGGRGLELSNGSLEWMSLPQSVFALGRASDGSAVFYGRVDGSGDLVRITQEGTDWAVSATVPMEIGETAQWIIPVSDTSILVADGSGSFIDHALENGTWKSSQPLSYAGNVTSAVGAPAKVLSGQYELELYTPDASGPGGWSMTDLGKMGVPPTYAPSSGLGCRASGGDMMLALLALIAMTVLGRARRNHAEADTDR